MLDTNFWLSTHVTIITTGYMACCVAGLIGHVYMVQAILQQNGGRGGRGGRVAVDDKRLAHTYRTMYGTLALGLTFSFVGTMLGGIWADQSWGRFWGWDPKENGALLIVLWCAILFHARMGKMIGPFGMAAGSALLIIVVMMAWFGINLLGVGLHSYGFIDGVLLGLLAYSAAQACAVAALAGWYRHRKRRGPPPEPPPAGAGSAAAGTANGTARAAERVSGGWRRCRGGRGTVIVALRSPARRCYGTLRRTVVSRNFASPRRLPMSGRRSPAPGSCQVVISGTPPRR